MPLSNSACTGSLSRCDGSNIQQFTANLAVPQNSNFGVARLDHDFGDKWHFMSSYRYYKLTSASTDQVDIGGFFPGDKLGTPASQSSNPQEPWYLRSRADHQHQLQCHQRFSLQLLAQLVGLEQGGRYATTGRLGRSARTIRRKQDPVTQSLQREHRSRHVHGSGMARTRCSVTISAC